MSALLFRPVLSSAVRMSFPLCIVLLLVPAGRRSIRPRTLLAIQKLMMAGMFLALLPAFLGPLARVPVSYQLSAPMIQAAPVPSILSERPEVLPGVSAAEPAASGIVSAFSLWEAAGALWLCGAAARLALTLIQNTRFLRRLRQDSFPAASELSRLEFSCSRAIGLLPPPAVMIAPAASSPMAAGCLRPVIFLPARVLLLPQEQQRLLLIHELHHCKSKDNLWRVVSSVLLAVYWFDPLIWALACSFSTQCELCCDENVLSGAPVHTRKLYGGLLLSFATENPSPLPVPFLQSGWNESFRAFKLRIGQVVSPERKIPGKVLLVICCVIFLLFSGMIDRELFTPSEVVVAAGNEEGLAWELEGGMPTPGKIFPIRPPLDTDEVYRETFFLEDGTPFSDTLYFYAAAPHQPVVAGCDGVVSLVYEQIDLTPYLSPNGYGSFSNDEIPGLALYGFGNLVVVDCGDGVTVRYCYLDSILAEEGQWVRAGDILGTAGNTGSSYLTPDQCGIYVMQDGVMVDPTLFFDVSTEPVLWPGIPWTGEGVPSDDPEPNG